MSDSDTLYSVKEAAAYLTVARSTLYLEVKAKRITPVKVRGSTRFRRSELERYLRDRERRSAA